MKKLSFLLPAVLLLPVAFFYFKYNPAGHHLLGFHFPKCPFLLATHLYCPGCGSQRAVHQLLHGQLAQAADYNLLLVMSLPLLAAHAAVWVWSRFSQRPAHLPWLYHPRTTAVLLWTVLGFWVLRNIPVFPFTLLAP